MRYVVLGAGAIGGVIGGRLHQHGHDVVLVARGAHLDAIAASGLVVRDPDAEVALDVPVVGAPAEIDWRDDDVVLLCTKTHQLPAALDHLAAAAPPDTHVVCFQNGVAAERLVLRRFANVHGVPVMMPATHLRPGEVLASSAPTTGLLDVGRYPQGTDDVDERIAADLAASTFSALPLADVMPWKRSKLLMNLNNAAEAACGDLRADPVREVRRRAHEEAVACFEAEGWTWISDEEFRVRRGDLITMRPIGEHERGGGSTWQSLARGMGATEVDYLNGEIVLLGRLHGIPTPANAALQATVHRIAAAGLPPGSVSPDELLEAMR